MYKVTKFEMFNTIFMYNAGKLFNREKYKVEESNITNKNSTSIVLRYTKISSLLT